MCRADGVEQRSAVHGVGQARSSPLALPEPRTRDRTRKGTDGKDGPQGWTPLHHHHHDDDDLARPTPSPRRMGHVPSSKPRSATEAATTWPRQAAGRRRWTPGMILRDDDATTRADTAGRAQAVPYRASGPLR
jgi:hypothetical protein